VFSGLKTRILNPSPPKESVGGFLGWMGSLPVGGGVVGVWQRRHAFTLCVRFPRVDGFSSGRRGVAEAVFISFLSQSGNPLPESGVLEYCSPRFRIPISHIILDSDLAWCDV